MTGVDGLPCNESQLTCSLCRALRPPKRLQARLITAEVFPSRWLRERLGRTGSVIQNFSTSPVSDDRRSAWSNPPTVVYIGALTAHKLGSLLEGFAIARTQLPMRLVIAGAGPLEPLVSAMAASASDVSYLGPITPAEREKLFCETSLVVIPSTCTEASSLVFYEALAAGLPVIASDIGGLTELERFGNVVLVRPGEPEALGVALSALLADERTLAALREAAYRHRRKAASACFVKRTERMLALLADNDALSASPTRG